MTSPLKDKRMLLGVTGSIACYKATDLASKLTQAGAQVDTVLTQAALRFVSPLTFQSVTGRRSFTDNDLWDDEAHILHVYLAKNAQLMIIAPATANTIAKLAHGMADNLLTVSALAASCPVLVAPAMDGEMWSHPATQANADLLRQRGVEVVGPAEGHLASGLVGIGRMVDPVEVLGHVRLILARNGPLAGRKVVVTAGGTQEPIDPVRVISNRSSGKQGFALAQAALDQGAEVILISGPVALSTPVGAQRVNVETAEEMHTMVMDAIDGADILIMAAAVADFSPELSAEDKIKRAEGIPQIKLKETPDILAHVVQVKAQSGQPKLVVGFAAESRDLIANALHKLESKKLDMIVANDISANDAGFNADTNRVILLYSDGCSEPLPLMSKSDVAEVVLEKIINMISDEE